MGGSCKSWDLNMNIDFDVVIRSARYLVLPSTTHKQLYPVGASKVCLIGPIAN